MPLHIYLAAGTSTSAGGQSALKAACEYLCLVDAHVVITIPRSRLIVSLPSGPTYVQVSRLRALILELLGPACDVDYYIGFADRVPILRNSFSKILVVQNSLLYRPSKVDGNWQLRIQLQLQRVWARQSLKKADRIVVLTNSSASEIRTLAGVNPNRIAVRPIPPQDLPTVTRVERDEIQNIVLIGDIRPYKRFAWAIHEINSWGREERGIRVTHIGGSDDRFGRTLVTDCLRNVSNCEVTFLGRISHAETMILLSKADVFIFPSAIESFGIPLVEAMSLGVPSICSDIPQFHDVGGDAPIYVSDKLGAIVEALETLRPVGERVRRSRLGLCSQNGNAAAWDVTGGLIAQTPSGG